jgi:hypothetical protein
MATHGDGGDRRGSTGATRGGSGALRWSLTLALGLIAAGPARAAEPVAASAQVTHDPRESPWYLSGHLGTILLGSPSSDSSGWRVGRTLAVGLAAGHRWGPYDAFLVGEANGWTSNRPDGSDDLALAVNLGLGGGFSYAGGFLRTSLAGGVSLLAVPTDVDSAGSTGFFVGLCPVSYRWPLSGSWVLAVQPLSLTVVMPVLTGIPLIEIEFRTSLAMEYALP